MLSVITVSTNSDAAIHTGTSLRDAIQSSTDGDTITFSSSLTGKTITLLQGELLVTKSLTISGTQGGASQVVVDGNLNGRVFDINSGTGTKQVTISDLAIQNGGAFTAGGGGIYNADLLTLLRDTISGNRCFQFGGGIYNVGNLSATNCTIVGNFAEGFAGSGGGIYNGGTVSAMVNVTVTGNATTDGTSSGAGISNAPGKTFVAVNSLVVGNTKPGGVPSELTGSFTAGSSNNLVGIPSGKTLSDIVQTSSGVPVLANNGGATRTIALISSAANPAVGIGLSSLTILNQNITNADTSAAVVSSALLAVGDYLQIESEFVQVTFISGNVIGMLRGQLGSTAAAHSSGAGINVTDQRGFYRSASPDVGAFEIQSTAFTNVTIASGTYTSQQFAVTNATVSDILTGATVATFGSPYISYAYYSGTLTAGQVATATPLAGAPRTVGNYTVVATFSNAPGYNPTTSAPTYFSITPATLIINATSNVKVYDTTTTAAAIPTVVGLLGTDSVTGLTEAYLSKNALGVGGSTLVVTGYNVVDGDGGADYVVTINSATGTITPATLTFTALTNTKSYDANTSATAVPTVSGLLGSDTASATEAYASKNVLGTNGSTLIIDTYSINDGNSGKNYSPVTVSAMGTITQTLLKVFATTNTKVYDGTTSAAAIPTAVGLLGTDTMTNASEVYLSKNVKGTNQSALVLNAFTINDGNSGANYLIATIPAQGTITVAALTITATTNTKSYDGTTSATATPTVNGLKGTDSVTGLGEAYVSKNVLGTNGSTLVVTTYTVNDGNGGNNYATGTASALGTITPVSLTINAASNTKIYDATTSAAAVPTVSGLIGTDSVTGLTEAYTSKNVKGANGSTLVVTGYTILDGNSGNNYVTTTNSATGTITPAALTITAAKNTKVYDGTTSAVATPTTTGLLGTDSATGLTEAYTSKDVKGTNGSTLIVTGYNVVDGNGGQNYTVTTATNTGTITAAALTITAAPDTKVYDGTTSSYAIPTVAGLFGTDSVTGLTEAFASKDVKGTNGSTMIVTGYTVVDGNGGQNYTVTTATNTGTITPATLTITASANTKVYDSTTSAAAIPTVSGLLGSDSVTGLTEAYTSKDVKGTDGSTLIVTGYTVVDGNGGNDYIVTTVSGKGTITPAALTIAAAPNTKVYDATTSATAIPTVTGLIGSDSATGLTEAYTSKNVKGTNGSTLVVTGYTIVDGNGGQNYSVTTSTANGTITAASLTIAAASNVKVYDGTTSATAIPTVTGLLGTDTATGLVESYVSKDVKGTDGSTLIVTGYTINDTNSGQNYSVTTSTAKGTITPAALTINATTNTKVYDATTSAAAIPTVVGLQGSDTATGLVEAYVSKDVLGTNGSTLTVTAYTINDGNSGSNYTVGTSTAKGTITAAALTISAAPDTKVYDGTTSSSAIPTVSGLFGSDSVTGLTEAYTSKDVKGPNGSTLTVTGYTINDGNGGNDYIVTTMTSTGTITPASLTITAAKNTKVYDATTSASATPTVAGLFGTDSVSGLTEAYISKDVKGTDGSTLVVTGYTVNDGNGGNDYIVSTASSVGTITPAALTITAATNTKVYDGTTSASAIPTVSNLFGSDTVTGLAETYLSKDVLGANASTLAVSAYTVNDGNGGKNYVVGTATAKGTITPASLTIAAATNTKTYDGTTSASAVPTVAGLFGSDTVTGLTEAYTSKDVKGTNGSTLVVTGYTVNDGNGGQDYVVTTATAKGTITPAALTIAAAKNTKVYDATTSAAATPTVSGLFTGDTATGLTEAYTSKDVKGTDGSTLVVTGYTINDGNGGQDYTVTTVSATGTITPATLTITATTNSKIYDGTTSAAAVPTATGLLGTDTATGMTEAYISKNVLGTNGSTLVVTGYTVNDGNSGNNYIVGTVTGKGTITPAALTLSATTNTKVYDGTTSAAAVPSVVGLQGSDTVTGLTEAYTSKDVLGTNGSTLIVTGYTVNDGNSGNNYIIGTNTAKGTITQATLTISATTNTKVYDGTTSATATPTVSGLQGSDTVSGLVEAYNSKNVLGTNGSTLSVSGYTVNDNNGGNNYAVTLTTATGTITPAALTVAAVTNTKVYDATTSAAATPTVTGLQGTDTVTGRTEAYGSKNVLGTNGSVLLVTGYTVNDGNSGANYTVTVTSANGTITPATLTIAATTNTKVYDGTTSAAALPTTSGLKGSDTVTGLSESYTAYSALGTNKSVLRVNSGYSINDGNGGANYNVLLPFALGTITPASLTIAPANSTKVFDGTTSSNGRPIAISGLIPGDILTGTIAYTSKDVKGINGSTMIVTSYSVGDGNGGNNYVVTVQTGVGTITPATLTIAATTNTKVYDGTKLAAAIPTVTGLIGTDTVTGNLSERYTAYSALGTNNSVLVVNPGYVVNDGNGGANYRVVTTTAAGTITPASLTIAATTNTKVYDTTTSAAAIPTVTGLVPGDLITGLKEQYLSPNALGVNGSSLQAFGYTIGDGNGGNNYIVSLPIAKGTITPAALTIAATTNTKVYDGTKSAAAIPTVSGLKGSDSVSGVAEQYDSYNVLGTNNSVLRVIPGFTINDGNSGGNYLVSLATANGTITQAALTIAPAPFTKVFDGTTAASAPVIALSGLQPGDAVSGSTAFTSKNVMGTNGSTLVITSYAIADGNAGKNYSVTVNTGLGTITPATLTIAATTNTKVYDGTKSAAAKPTVSGLIGSDTVTGNLSEQYTSYSALGTNNSVLRVDPGYVVVDGNGGANYSVVTPFALGTITPKALTLTAVTNTKVYDGTTSALARPTSTGLVTGDYITGLTESYLSPNVMGVNRSTLVVNQGFVIGDGNGGANYVITYVNATGTITPAPLTIAAVTNTKSFDGTTSAVSKPTVTGLFGTDTVTNLSEQYTSANPMGVNGSTLVVSLGYVVNDTNSGNNYAVTTTTAKGTIFPGAT